MVLSLTDFGLLNTDLGGEHPAEAAGDREGLQTVCGNQGLGLLSPRLACDQDPHQATLTDLQSENTGVLPPSSLSSRLCFSNFLAFLTPAPLSSGP
ncbi:hypothetical protein COCON_G00193370 [Conger conger]|uniref:Uncharacterized protein n=1 Tax=Conger conger TaxID=82655 RepID=A0A9Q1D1I8_CONCO|nr:hypothetical protein COCON_G00193370 [Conger conger]